MTAVLLFLHQKFNTKGINNKLLLLPYLVCSPGYFKDSTTDECKACPKETFSDEVDATSCTSCPEGQTTSGEGNTECRAGKTIYHINDSSCFWRSSAEMCSEKMCWSIEFFINNA